MVRLSCAHSMDKLQYENMLSWAGVDDIDFSLLIDRHLIDLVLAIYLVDV